MEKITDNIEEKPHHPIDKYITVDDINEDDLGIDDSMVLKETRRRILKGLEKIKRNATKKALKSHFGDIQPKQSVRHNYKRKDAFKNDLQKYMQEEPHFLPLSTALSGEGKLYEHLYRDARRSLVNKKKNDYVRRHNEKVTKYLKNEKKRLQKEAMLTKIPDRYCDLYPLARRLHRQFVLHVGPTNSGKTYAAMEELLESNNGVYLAPLRLLAYENYEKIMSRGVKCNMVTGEVEIFTPGANITCATVEMADLTRHFQVAIIDEAQMISNTDRGGAWTQATFGICADKVHVCMSEEAFNIVVRLITECGDDYTVIHHERKTVLKPQKTAFRFPRDVKKGDALIVFSRKDVLKYATFLERQGIKCSMIYGNLPYDVRHQEAARFISGETKVVVATDAIGMGLNLPIRRVVFLETAKFDGYCLRHLEPEEIRQIAGRAGRFGIYNTGYFASAVPEYINKAYYCAPCSIGSAMINIPSNLIDICDKYSDLLKRWREIAPRSYCVPSDIETKLFLAMKLEEICDNKYLIADFVSIPFDVKIKPVHSLWYELFKAELQGKDYVINLIAELLGQNMVNNLHYLEIRYKMLDLAFSYCRKFDLREGLEPIMKEKKTVSERINEILVDKASRSCVS